MKTRKTRPYRLGLDLGTNSLGWFTVRLDQDGDHWRPTGLGAGGVRVYPDGRDPQSETSNAVSRRVARSARRRRDRFADQYFGRRTELMKALVHHGLMPEDVKERKALEALDPYELRANALDGPLLAHHIGRAIFHLNQRRGFLSNRKAEKKEDDKGAIKQAAGKLKEAMEAKKARTLGEFLWHRHQKREGVRARNTASGPKATYDFYPTRDLLKSEFDAIWSAQAPHHPSMTDAAREEIDKVIFYQRPLKQPPVGKCSLDPATEPFEKDPEGYRCPWAHPLAQRFRIYQEVRNLEVGETGRTMTRLTKQQGDLVALALLQNKEMKFDKLRSLLKLSPEAKFNLESERRVTLDGDETAARLSHKSLFGKTWRGLDVQRQIAIVEKLLNEPDDAELVQWLEDKCELAASTAEKVADASLPDGHCRLGLRTIKKLLPLMESGLRYDEAAANAIGGHAKLPTGEVRDKLPYYGEWLSDAVVGSGDRRDKSEKRFGRLPNPTVHIGLGQLRRLVNHLINEFGPPTEVAIEFTRALKLSPKEKAEYQREQRRNQEKNEARKKELAEHGLSANPRNLLKMRLWEELNPRDLLDRKCPFTGEQIGLARLMSDEVEIEHLAPFKESLDDSAANKTVCMRYANRAKRKQWPYNAFGSNPTIDGFTYRWDEIAARAAMLPRNKRWRFDADAREQFEKKGGFLNRQLNETGWLARLAKQYLGAVTNPYNIWVVPGRLTSMIRGKWGLNSLLPDHNYAGVQDKAEDFLAATDDMEFSGVKNRADHRHHAIDGLVAALTDRSLLWKMANAYDDEREKIEIPTPWDKEKLRDDLKAALDRMVVSHKPDHGVQGKLHEDTAYGFVKEPEREGANLVYRKPIEALNENEVERIRDRRLRDMVRAHVVAEKANGVTLADALRKLHAKTDDPHIKHGLRRVRLLKPEKPEYLVPVNDRRTGAPYKAYSAGENFCVEIFETADGKWIGEAVRRFDANQECHGPRWRQEHPDAKLVMRVHKGDLIRLENNGKSEIMVVHRLDAAARRFKLAQHNETGNLDRRHATSNEIDPFRWLMASYGTLKDKGAVPVRVDELGQVWRIQTSH
ncbi:MAG: type II CRISPR RNA-guided endonuclease Cas9 [Xanthobacteraceae bacterium]